MEGYTLKGCLEAKLAERNGNGTYKCKLLGVCTKKKFSGFRTLCEEGLLYELNMVAEAKKPGARGI